MLRQDAQGNIIYNDPLEHIIQRGAQNLNNKQFTVTKNIPSATDYQATWATLPSRDYRTFGDKLKAHYNAFTDDPWAWAQDNPWKAAGGIGALTALTSGILNSGNNSNNRSNSFNILNSLIPGLLIGGLAYGGIKAWPYLKEAFNKWKNPDNMGESIGRGHVKEVVDTARRAVNKVKKNVNRVGEESGRIGRADVTSSTKKRVGTPIVPSSPKRVDANGNTVPRGVDSQGRRLVRREEDVAKGWKPVKDANGNIIRYEETNKSIWDRFMDFKRGMYD
jgi:hypothetical protein